MENKRGKGLSFARRIYKPRIIGLGIGSISVIGALSPLSMPGWVWALLLFNGYAWAHVAYLLSTRSPFPYQAEQRNMLYDSLFGGFWAAAIQFTPLATVTILSMMTMNNVAAGGKRLFLRGLVAQAGGIGIAWWCFGITFNPNVSPVQVYTCLPMLTLYPMAIGMVCYQLAIKLSEHKRTLSALSRIDSLTGLLNHGSWKDLLNLKFHKCQQQQGQATIALIDIDHFKQINDTHGHIVGDTVLRQLSQLLRQHLRENDFAGRYGGDEFCVILPKMPLQEAVLVMERMRETFSNYRNPQIPELRISLSIGLADFQPVFSDAVMWLNAADRALYVAKKTGRNRVKVSEYAVACSA
ncbi:diguanylate cyclase [Pseudomonas sp. R11F]|uniref:diguanylate cyclase n=1 Tax=Pseudomonas palleroniana TaxID=191390 RepID=A0A1H5MIU5_9PSED|nr:diguanylate cyclase [Pseudomonas palleroniana]AVE05327.1 diguanylate cyclase AdrA [Pseudomonas palleroniana]KAB0568062.1 diguanylate cyclase [Pseudomonas palleroniana]KWU47749.1 diguanylate cyclase AdrA [Pseudomonas palleroniana]PTC22891.1 diguanylate cyclase AdrA [Pseudomonas palleroniana]UOK39959.1 diguanylate cyclase [Pseudomonas palleroniana]